LDTSALPVASEADLYAAVQAAHALVVAGRWSEAAVAYADIADLPGLSVPARQQSLSAAGDALRRADRPAAAAKTLTAAIQVDPEGAKSGMLRVRLAGVLQQAGQLDIAADIAREGLARSISPLHQAVALDTLIGTLHALGQLDEAHTHLKTLAQIAPKPMQAAVWFRQGTRLRMAGDLTGADARYAAAAEAMAEHPGAAAAAIMSRAEVALFAGDPDQAAAHYTHAGKLWTAAGRRAGLYRSEAGLIRAALSAGQAVLSAGVHRPIEFARERQLPLLLAHLLLARGAADRSDADLSEAVSLAQCSGAVLLEGRARVVRSRRGGDYGDADRIAVVLADDVAWMAVFRDGSPMPY
jgi:tetratricopeptide (TPR) repeat protein